MSRILALLVLCAFVVTSSSCSRQKPSESDADEWSDIQPLPDSPAKQSDKTAGEPVPEGEFDGFIQRLAQMKSVERQPGETLLTGKTLTLDYAQHFVGMDEGVKVVDDYGTLKTDSLIGRFSSSNQVESVEAKGHVQVESEGRHAEADNAVYTYSNGMVQLNGMARISEGENRLSGESIRFWLRDDRKMVCEPNAVLVVTGASTNAVQGVPGGKYNTEVRANRIVYDEDKMLVDLQGHVRLRDPQVAMNCGQARLFLKDDNKLDWIEAVSEVIIHSDDRKALAERATYHADEGKITLEGHPKVMQGRNVMTGDRITFWHTTRRMVCEPNARVLLYLDEATRAKFLKDLND